MGVVSIKLIMRAVVIASMVAAAVYSGESQSAQARARAALAEPDFSKVEVHSIHVQGNVYMLVGAGGNVTLQIGDEGVMVIDTQFAQMSDKLLAEIRRLAGNKPIRWVINTHGHADHIGGNAAIRAAGRTILVGNVANDPLRGETGEGAILLAHENVQLDMVKLQGTPQAVDEADWPTEVYIGDNYQFSFNGEAITLFHQPNAHTNGDTMIHFRRSDVLVTGDLYQTLTYPYIDRGRGGTFLGVLAALNRMIEIAVPLKKQEGGTMVIPGHGRISDEADVVEYRDMLTAIKTRVEHMIEKGATVEQVKAARLTRDYDSRWGANSPFWTTEMFVEAVYEDLKAANNSDERS